MPALMHGAINAFTVSAYIVKPEYADKAILGPAYNGMISMIPMIAAACILYIKRTRTETAVNQ